MSESTEILEAGISLEGVDEESSVPEPKGCRSCFFILASFALGFVLAVVFMPMLPVPRLRDIDVEDAMRDLRHGASQVKREAGSLESQAGSIAHEVAAVEQEVVKALEQTHTSTTATVTHTTATLTTTLSQVLVVTVQTKGEPLIENIGPPFQVLNLGTGKPWHGFKTKFQLLLPFLDELSEEHLVAFVDGTDVFWGGCQADAFLASYYGIRNRSGGAPIVFSAEIACGEQPCWEVPEVPFWASQHAHRNLNGGFWKPLVAAGGCQNHWCPCAKPPAVKFLNSGFFMGPVHALRHMVKWALYRYNEYSTLGDQSVLAYYWMHHRDRIVLDYAGDLCLTLSDLDHRKIFRLAKDGGVWNKAFGHEQCFIHGNGRARSAMWDMLGEFARRRPDLRYSRAFVESTFK